MAGAHARPTTDAAVRVLGPLVSIEFLLLAFYFGATHATAISLRYVLYPLVWIDVAVWVVYRTGRVSATTRRRLVAAAVAAAYVLVLAAIAGVIRPTPDVPASEYGLRLVGGPPGWGPAVVYLSSTVQVAAVPYLVVGYLALGYLVYVTVLRTATAALSGVVGVASCVGCGVSIAASLVAGVAGGGSALTAAAYELSVDLSTLVFLVAAAALYWAANR